MPARVNEFEIIERYFAAASDDPDVLLGAGDDAALLKADGTIAVTVDTLVEGVHFPAGIDAEALGHRVLAVNLSDLAAMGARPRWCTLALTLTPAQAEPAWLEGFARGLFALASRFGVSLVGGNLARGPLSATLQLIGSVAPGEALRRAGGRPGDDLYVTGTLGDAAGGLAVLQGRAGTRGAPGAGEQAARASDALVERFLRPSPRIDAGIALRGVASAAIDVSDGLASDLAHLCRASGCGAVVDVERIPRSSELETLFGEEAALEHAVAGGDDYELCFAAAPADAGNVAAAAAAARTPMQRIGRLVERGPGALVEWRRAGAPFALGARGYSHF
ncbi:MAG TPA: thiamine-phosphate kinase [Gammaproteobacteria bacterium]|nr:thiamine-phosphate kinase [Gammaproteobacteria bacterium]